ncbi:MAG: hypothetical protein AB7I27_18020 [Bacteriovoracaceae bacterium]
MSTLKINHGTLKPKINLPSSKSYANRVLILAALKQEVATIRNISDSSDVIHLLDSLESIDLKIEKIEDTIKIHNSFPACENGAKTIKVGEGGTTARFLACMLLRGKEPYTLILGDRLKERPWKEFIQFVNDHHGKASLVDNQLLIQGPIKLPRKVEFDCSKTTQFATGLSLAFPEATIVPINLASSQSYWKMTEKIKKDFAFSSSYSIPLDWSSASYPMAFAALNQKIKFPELKYDEFQADSKLYNLLKQMDALEEHEDGIIVNPIKRDLIVKMNVSDCLDLVPTLAYLLSHIDGEHLLEGITNLVHKESDRLSEVVKLVRNFGRDALVQDEKLFIKGSQKKILDPIDLFMPDDHRMVMVGALFLLHHSGGSIRPMESVKKSYPDFFSIFNVTN